MIHHPLVVRTPVKYFRFIFKGLGGSYATASSCGQEIKELRDLNIPDGIFKELWVRGPDRTWHRYLVLADGIESLENEEDRRDVKDSSLIPDVQQILVAG